MNLAAVFFASFLAFSVGSGREVSIVAPAEVQDWSAGKLSSLSAGADWHQTSSPQPAENNSLWNRLFGSELGPGVHEGWLTRIIKALVSFIVATLLATVLAFRPRKNISLFRRNPFIAQTQILLAVVGAAMMIVVGDNAARAFGIFAAAALIRFRTNIRDPKEITVLLVCLSIGLASGVGRWEIATTLTLFVLIILWPLEHYELSQVVRAMEVEVKTFNLAKTEGELKKIFKKYGISAELRKIDPEDQEDSPSIILYYVTLSPDISTDRLSREIFSSDSQNIDSIKWEQKKSDSYIYR
jgi:hypothetical protein